jgi:predicted secreted protein
MAKEKGTKVLLQVSDGTSPGVFTTLAGQRDTSLGRTSEPIDVTDKASGDWREFLAGPLDMTVNASGVADWPDTAGLEALRVKFEANESVECRILLNNSGDYYQANFSILDLSIQGRFDGATEYTLQLRASSQPQYTAA